jgi:hypothetical protein
MLLTASLLTINLPAVLFSMNIAQLWFSCPDNTDWMKISICILVHQAEPDAAHVSIRLQLAEIDAGSNGLPIFIASIPGCLV